MYTLETKHRPIPEKVLPKSKEPQVYYIEPKQAGPTPEDDIPAKQEGISKYSLTLYNQTMYLIDFYIRRSSSCFP